jgi:hypothetical protein
MNLLTSSKNTFLMFKHITEILKTHALVLCAGNGERWKNIIDV